MTAHHDDLIISGGVNAYPQEIGAILPEVHGVWDGAVVGVPDARFGERPVAFVVAEQHGEDGKAGADATELKSRLVVHCEQHLGRARRPAEIRPIDAPPRSPTRKLLRRQLRKIFIPRT